MPPETDRSDRTDRWVGRAITLIGWAIAPAILYLVLHGVGRPLWLDDTHSTYHAYLGGSGVVESLRTDSHPPLYFALLSYWISLVGLGEAWLRLPSILFTLAGGLVLFAYGRRTGGVTLGVSTAVFFLFHPVVVGHMHTVRPYALAGLLAAVSTVLYMRLATSDEPSPWGAWLGFGLANALGTLTHYWFFFVMAGQGLGAVLFAPGRARWKIPVSLAVAAMPFAVFWGPVFMVQLQGGPTSWMEVPNLAWGVLRAPLDLLGGAWPYSFPAKKIVLLLAVALVVPYLPLPRRAPLDEAWSALADRRLGLAAAIPATVMLIALAASQIRPVFNVRYILVASPALAIFLSLLLTRLGDRRLLPVICAYFVFASVAYRDGTLRFDNPPEYWGRPPGHEGIREVVRYVTESYRDGDEIINIALGYAPTKHYLAALSPDRSYVQRVFPLEMERHVGWRNPAEILEDSDDLAREAAALAGDLAEERDVGRVWFIPDAVQDSILSNLMRDELDSALVLEAVVPLHGWGASEVRVYKRSSDETERTPLPEPASAPGALGN